MAITIEAVYENGVLKPKEPLPLQDQQSVRITIHPAASLAQESYGLLRWTGEPEMARRIAEDDEFSILESQRKQVFQYTK